MSAKEEERRLQATLDELQQGLEDEARAAMKERARFLKERRVVERRAAVPDSSMIKTDVAAVLQDQLESRNVLIKTMKDAYLRDVVAVREVLSRCGAMLPEAEGRELDASLEEIPSLSFTARLLPIFAPAKYALNVRPCGQCGGAIELLDTTESGLVHGAKEQLEAATAKILLVEKQLDAKEKKIQDQVRRGGGGGGGGGKKVGHCFF